MEVVEAAVREDTHDVPGAGKVRDVTDDGWGVGEVGGGDVGRLDVTDQACRVEAFLGLEQVHAGNHGDHDPVREREGLGEVGLEDVAAGGV